MAILDTLYDVISGLGGTIFGIVVTTLINRGRTKRLNQMLAGTQSKLDDVANENSRLMGALREKENMILELERRILEQEKMKGVKKRRK